MGATPKARCRSAVRPLLLALLAAVAWLVWGAGAATASSLAPDAGDLLKPAASPLAEPLPAIEPPPVVSAGELAEATATSVTNSATGVVTPLAAPALPVVSGTVDTVTDLAPSLPELPLVQAPLPLPLTDVLPLPDQLPPLLPEPLPAPLPLPLPDLAPVPGIAPLPSPPPLPTPAPGRAPTAAPSLPASDAVAADGVGTQGSAAANIIATPTEPANVAVESNTLGFGFTPAQDRPGVASPAAATASPSGPEDRDHIPGRLDLPAAANAAGTASSGSAGGADGAADLGGSWTALPAAVNGPKMSGAETLPAGPSFDPGSSPD
ncbi:hypothetical protein ACFC25_11465 [Pseudarthrobacter sp. NPDC055928]|uniref:hypothetical protein n=1 Tax=Pseudarthrobacter sp. NPDC055928 TaxID=3345661 RepID=UPI0035E34F26